MRTVSGSPRSTPHNDVEPQAEVDAPPEVEVPPEPRARASAPGAQDHGPQPLVAPTARAAADPRTGRGPPTPPPWDPWTYFQELSDPGRHAQHIARQQAQSMEGLLTPEGLPTTAGMAVLALAMDNPDPVAASRALALLRSAGLSALSPGAADDSPSALESPLAALEPGWEDDVNRAAAHAEVIAVLTVETAYAAAQGTAVSPTPDDAYMLGVALPLEDWTGSLARFSERLTPEARLDVIAGIATTEPDPPASTEAWEACVCHHLARAHPRHLRASLEALTGAAAMKRFEAEAWRTLARRAEQMRVGDADAPEVLRVAISCEVLLPTCAEAAEGRIGVTRQVAENLTFPQRRTLDADAPHDALTPHRLTPHGKLPLEAALFAGDRAAVRALIDAGCSIRTPLRPRFPLSPVETATSALVNAPDDPDRLGILEDLLEAGAPPAPYAPDAVHPLDLAYSARHTKAEMLLRKHGARFTGAWSVPDDTPMEVWLNNRDNRLGARPPVGTEDATPGSRATDQLESCMYAADPEQREDLVGRLNATLARAPSLAPILGYAAALRADRDPPPPILFLKDTSVYPRPRHLAPVVRGLNVDDTVSVAAPAPRTGATGPWRCWITAIHELTHSATRSLHPDLAADAPSPFGVQLHLLAKQGCAEIQAAAQAGVALPAGAQRMLALPRTDPPPTEERLFCAPEILVELGDDEGQAWMQAHAPTLLRAWQTEVMPRIETALAEHPHGSTIDLSVREGPAPWDVYAPEALAQLDPQDTVSDAQRTALASAVANGDPTALRAEIQQLPGHAPAYQLAVALVTQTGNARWLEALLSAAAPPLPAGVRETIRSVTARTRAWEAGHTWNGADHARCGALLRA